MIAKKRRESSEFEKRLKTWSRVERESEVNSSRVLTCFALLCFKEWQVMLSLTQELNERL